MLSWPGQQLRLSLGRRRLLRTIAASHLHDPPALAAASRRIEFSWIRDDRSRVGLDPLAMAGVQRALIIARTNEGQMGTAGAW